MGNLARLGQDAGDDAATAMIEQRHQRGSRWTYRRVDWEYDLEMLRNTGQFQSRYYMSEPAFGKLARIARSDVPIGAKQPWAMR